MRVEYAREYHRNPLRYGRVSIAVSVAIHWMTVMRCSVRVFDVGSPAECQEIELFDSDLFNVRVPHWRATGIKRIIENVGPDGTIENCRADPILHLTGARWISSKGDPQG